MKVGDIVRQSGKLLRMSRDGKPIKPSQMLGVVLAIEPLDPRFVKYQPGWAKRIGRPITVRWNNGTIKESYAEGALEVVSSTNELDDEQLELVVGGMSTLKFSEWRAKKINEGW